MAGSNANIAFSGTYDSWAVGSKKLYIGIVAFELVIKDRFVVCWHAFSNSDNKFDSAFSCFHDSVAYASGWYEDATSCCAGCFDCLCNICVDGYSINVGSCFLWMCSSYYLRPVLSIEPTVVASLRSSKSLVYDFCCFIYENAHVSPIELVGRLWWQRQAWLFPLVICPTGLVLGLLYLHRRLFHRVE